MKRQLKRFLTAPLFLVAALVVLLEDWLWDDLARLAAAIGRLPVFRQREEAIGRLGPYASLSLFALPTLLLVPVKLLAVWFIAHGKAGLGLATAVAAKLVGTALVARIYALTEIRLLTIAWFAVLHRHIGEFRRRVYERLRSSGLYRVARRLSERIRALRLRLRSGGFIPARWRAALRLRRRAG